MQKQQNFLPVAGSNTRKHPVHFVKKYFRVLKKHCSRIYLDAEQSHRQPAIHYTFFPQFFFRLKDNKQRTDVIYKPHASWVFFRFNKPLEKCILQGSWFRNIIRIDRWSMILSKCTLSILVSLEPESWVFVLYKNPWISVPWIHSGCISFNRNLGGSFPEFKKWIQKGT